MSVFEELIKINVNEHTEQKGEKGFTYLSWTYAWSELMKVCPDAKYEIKKFDGKPYIYDDRLGIMVFTEMTIGNDTREMWLPVMDGANNAMKFEPYEVKGRYKTVTVKAATMMDINKTIMRCLVKNIAMFGLGLYIYAGEDLPADEEPEPEKKKAAKPKKDARVSEAEIRAKVLGYVNRHKVDAGQLAVSFGIKSLNEMNQEQCERYINFVNSKGGNIDE